MKSKRIVLGLLLTAVLSLLCLCGCSQGNPYDTDMPDYGYKIADMAVTVDASAGDRSMSVREEYTFTFREYSHGFYRDIAINSGEQIRGLTVTNASDFSNAYEVEEDSGVLRVRVGSASRYVATGRPLTCTIEYTLITPKHADYPDALVLNVIGQGWSCEIEHATVRVVLPAETSETPRYYYGGWGETNDAAADGKVSQAPVAGQSEYNFTVNGLEPYEGLTVYYFLPKGALKSRVDAGVWIILLAGLAVLGVAVACKFLLGRNAPLAPVTNYYPPKHPNAGDKELPMDPVDMGYLIDNTCQGTDVTSLIFYFASKGYLTIIAPEDGDREGAFSLKKECDLPKGLPSYQYTLFNKIFDKGDEVTVDSLTNRTYTAVQSAQTQIKNKYSGKLYSGGARAASLGVCALTVLYAFLAVFLAARRVGGLFSPLGLVAVLPVAICELIGLYMVNNRLKIRKAALYGLFAALVAAAVLLSLPLLAIFPRAAMGWPEAIIVAAVVAANSMIAPFIARRTKFYTNELNEILGFREFLQCAEKDRLEMLLTENPQYYYDILPYANVLGVSDIWQDKFEGLAMEPPTYYRGVSVFDIVLFNHIYRNSYRAFSVATVSRPSSSSRSGGGIHFGGGGGGGFSGGGFGGGGGGRW